MAPVQVFGRRDPDKPQPVVNHRVTIRMDVYHQVRGGEAEHFPVVFNRPLVIDEQTYDRKNVRVGQVPIPLPVGWLGEQNLPVAMFVMINLSDPVKEPNSWLDLCFKGEAAVRIPSGETQPPITPIDIRDWSIVGNAESTEFRIIVIPG